MKKFTMKRRKEDGSGEDEEEKNEEDEAERKDVKGSVHFELHKLYRIEADYGRQS
jgi:hypothetical protein